MQVSLRRASLPGNAKKKAFFCGRKFLFERSGVYAKVQLYFIMRLLDRYVFFEWLKIFVIAVGVTLGILVLHDMYGHLGDLLNWGASTREILLYYALFIPTLIPVILPISLLLSLIYVLGAMHRNNEITAMRAAGMNVFRITRSLWFAGAALSGILLWLNADLIPFCKENSRTVFDNARMEKQVRDAKDLSEVGVVNQLCFNNRSDGRLWYMNAFSQATNKGRGVRVSILDRMGREISRIMAREGVYDETEFCWFFTDGQEITYAPDTHRPIKAIGFDKKYYKNFDEEPNIMILSMRRPKDLSLFEAKTLIDSIGAESREALPYLVRWYSIWSSPFACLIVVAIAIPFSVAGVRTNPMVGVSKTFGLFFLFYVIDSVMTALGGRGIISAEVAAIVPNLAMFIFAMSLYRKAI